MRKKPASPETPAAEPIRLTSLSHGGGCGCKIAPGVLERNPRQDRARRSCPRNCWSASRPATMPRSIRSTTTQAIVATTDFFMPIVDDPVRLRRASRRPMPFPTSTRWAGRRCSRSPSSACRSTQLPLRHHPADPRRRRVGLRRGRHPDRGRPHHRFGRADLRPRGDRTGAPRRTSSATPTRARATSSFSAKAWASASTAPR